MSAPKRNVLLLILPGILVAATGVGAGDLATASFSGSQLGLAILWAVVVGGVFKFVLTEGLARWQLATGQTFLEGIANRFGPVLGWLFLPYLLLWSFFVGSALMSACGATLHAMIPVFDDASRGKLVFGIASSLVGLALVLAGGFKLFENVMSVCIGVMLVTVVVTAALLWPGTSAVLAGVFVPTIPDVDGQGLTWTVALVGGIGGTLTILCYGYWIREQGRTRHADIGLCRLDLGLGYTMTVVFGLAMVIIGSTVDVDGKGASLLVTLADRLELSLGTFGRWLFLIGAFGAVFSSLLGVWQAVPYLFADLWRIYFKGGEAGAGVDTRSMPYRGYLFAIALVPMAGLMISFKEVQKLYAVVGAAFIPLLALALLIMNGRRVWVGSAVNGWLSVMSLLLAMVFFGGVAWQKWMA